jgi:hypothetical protein
MTNCVSVKPQTGKLLLDEAPLVVLPSLARAIGLGGAVVLQQLHFLIRLKLVRHREHPKESERDIHDGHIWVWNSYQKWQENYFSFLTIRSLQRIFLTLEKNGLIFVANYNEYNLDKTKWYSINYDHPLINALTTTGTITTSYKKNEKNSSAVNSDQRKTVVDGANLARSTCQIGAFDSAKLAPSYTKNTTKTSTKTTTTTNDESSLSESSVKEKTEFTTKETFLVPSTTAEADEIIKDFLRITYPNGEGIKNKCSLSHFMKKKLMNGRLEIPEGWHDLQQKKNMTADQESKNNTEKMGFQKAKEEFSKLPTNEQNKYLAAARKTAKSVASVLSDSTALCIAIQIYSETVIVPGRESRPP